MRLGIIKYFLLQIATNVRLAQLDRAFGYGPKGRGFESSSARFFVRLRTFFVQLRTLFAQLHTLVGKCGSTDRYSVSVIFL